MCMLGIIGLFIGRGALFLISPRMSRRMLSKFLDNIREMVSTCCRNCACGRWMNYMEAVFTNIIPPQAGPETYSLWLEPVPIQVDAVKDD